MNTVDFSKENISKLLPQIHSDIHKGERGGVLICGGSTHFRGAPLLCALAALRSGAGYVVLAVPDFMADSACAFLPEAIIEPLKTQNGFMSREAVVKAIENWGTRVQAAAFGMGLGRKDSLKAVTQYFYTNWQKPLVFDADALYFLAQLRVFPRENFVVTPHLGEAATLLSEATGNIKSQRPLVAQRLAEKYGISLLKGKGTLLCDTHEIRKIVNGSPSLAIPGSGDVLSGILAAFLASGINSFDSACLAACVHALAGEKLEAKYGVRGALAREIAEEIPNVLKM